MDHEAGDKIDIVRRGCFTHMFLIEVYSIIFSNNECVLYGIVNLMYEIVMNIKYNVCFLKHIKGNYMVKFVCYVTSYQDGCLLVTVRTHGDFIVLPHWETGC